MSRDDGNTRIVGPRNQPFAVHLRPENPDLMDFPGATWMKSTFAVPLPASKKKYALSATNKEEPNLSTRAVGMR